jgi:hypothetical protein
MEYSVMSSSSTTTITVLISILIATSGFLSVSMNSQIEAPKSSLVWKLIYSLTTDHDTYLASKMIEATIWITNRNPYPMNFTPPSPFIYSGGYVGEYKIEYQTMPDWVISQVPANTTVKLTTMMFSTSKLGDFEITWRGLCVVVKVVLPKF